MTIALRQITSVRFTIRVKVIAIRHMALQRGGKIITVAVVICVMINEIVRFRPASGVIMEIYAETVDGLNNIMFPINVFMAVIRSNLNDK